MGSSADARLVFGIELPGETFVPWAQEFMGGEDETDGGFPDWDEMYSKACGIERVPFDENDEENKAWHEWWEKQKEAAKASGVELKSFGYGGCDAEEHTWILCLEDKGFWSYDYQAIHVPTNELEFGAKEITTLTDALKKIGLNPTDYDAPKWILCVSYG